ncbi:hypothetical protein CTAYLR_002773 [Chrysophaeum taylorii]|uniref:EF-hand domain-containing protein n=1 Tax=Chrysophaeum taylorii TaxID=2483200 RepID=A0AAD7XJU7_9STRA|nr:hypothetical protein CTAYLR_002773 [Chrysophaeum taylorii]
MADKASAQTRRRPRSTIKAHTWKPEAIRSSPDAAFDLFDANGDGVISVAELLFTTRKTNDTFREKGSIFDEMKLFHMLDVDGDSVITRDEFCSVIRDPVAFSDDALAAIAQLAKRRQEVKHAEEAAKRATNIHHSELKDERQDESRLIDDARTDANALAAVIGVVHGKELVRRNSDRDVNTEIVNATTVGSIHEWTPGDAMDLVLELFAVSVKPVEHAWYDVFEMLPPTTADPYVVIAGDKKNRRIELASTDVVAHSLTANWMPLRIKASSLRTLDEPFRVRAELYDAGTRVRIGETTRFDFPRSENLEAAVGPLLVLDNDSKIVGKIIGTAQWVNPITVDRTYGRNERKYGREDGIFKSMSRCACFVDLGGDSDDNQ